MVEQVSPRAIRYVTGVGVGTGVSVGAGVVGVGVTVIVAVWVIVGVVVAGTASAAGWRVAKYTRPAPITMKSKNKPKIAGKLNVIWGIRLPWTALDGLEGFSLLANSVPHTRQRAASSLCRVPQVGHTIVGLDFLSKVIMFSRQA